MITQTLVRTCGLPGIPVDLRDGTHLPAGQLPRRLLAPGTLLLAGVTPGVAVSRSGHTSQWGPMPASSLDQLVAAANEVDLRGAGGAGFPTARKLTAMAGERVSHVIVNGAEGESASGKDGVLLTHVPHLVLDGAIAVARATGADRVVVRISADRPDLAASLPAQLASRRERGLHLELSIGPAHFVAGEATAVIRSITGGLPLPADLGRPPRLPRKLPGRRPMVFLSNVETFARLALAARGYRQGSSLVSVSGAVANPGVLELDASYTLADAVALAGGLVGNPRTLITGGWHGAWVGWNTRTSQTALSREAVSAAGGRWGAGAFVWVPDAPAPLAALTAIAAELAAGTAGQCGPCWRGLPELADLLANELGRTSSAPTRATAVRAGDLMDQIAGRGICAHPSASVAAIRSALAHLSGASA